MKELDIVTIKNAIVSLDKAIKQLERIIANKQAEQVINEYREKDDNSNWFTRKEAFKIHFL